jgi:hypothetical protein
MSTTGERSGFAATVAATVALGLSATAMVAFATNRESFTTASTARSLTVAPAAATTGDSATSTRRVPTKLPFGDGPVFPGHMLVAYYGTAGTGSLGVLGEDEPDAITRRLRAAAKPFGTEQRPVQIVYELIVTVADGGPGPDGDYSHDISKDKVAAYIEAAHRNKALLVLDLQPGRSDFLTVAKRWKWALRDPWVGLALDPEWRMGPRQVPAQVIGSVGAVEVNRVSRWLRWLRNSNDLPEKIFMLHSFRTTMIRSIDRVIKRQDLAMVEHVDGFGTQAQKLATYHAVARPKWFHLGFKLFYDEDIRRMNAKQVKAIRPVVEFVSFQ